MGEVERWATPEEIAVARARFEAAIPGWQHPEAYGVGRRVGDGLEFGRINTEGHLLPAVVLATVCGHTGGSASYVLGLDGFDRAIELLAPAEADTSQPHPNLWAWQRSAPRSPTPTRSWPYSTPTQRRPARIPTC